MITFKEFKNNPDKAKAELGDIIYCEKPYVLLNKEGVVLTSGDTSHFLKGHGCLFSGDYYNACEFKLREHDIYMNDNRKSTLPLFI